MRLNLRPGPLALFVAAVPLFVAAVVWAGLTPSQVADVAPLGAPDGKVDTADVDLTLRAIAGDATFDAASLERADVAPVTAVTPSGGTPPQKVRPNPNPVGPVDIGDAVVIARRAAGLIAFDKVNQEPLLALLGDGDVVSVPAYRMAGHVVDDAPVATATVTLGVGGTTIEGIAITSANPSALEGDFAKVVTLTAAETTLTARARDSDGRLGRIETIHVILDQTPPSLTLTSPADGLVTRATTLEVAGTASDAHGLDVTVDGVEALQLPPNLWGATVPLPFENENTLVVVARDRAMPPNETSLTRVVVRDTTAPELLPDTVPAAVSTHTYALSGEVRDAWGIESVTVNGEAASLTWNQSTQRGRWIAVVTVLDGANEYVVEAIDRAGNKTTLPALKVRGDFEPPVVTLSSPAFVRATPAAITVDVSETVLIDQFGTRTFTPAVRADGPSYTQTGVALVEGQNTITVRVRDLAGNTTTAQLTVTLDTQPPAVRITRISNSAFRWVPDGGLDGVLTNAPAATIEGTVSDAIGVETVKVNGFDATVNASAGTFVVAGIPLMPRANTITAAATDLAGNKATHAISVRRDAEGPVLSLNFPRGAYVSTRNPAPAPFDVNPLPQRLFRSATDIVVAGTGSDPNYTGRIETLTVRLDGSALPVTGAAPFSTFSFTLPAAALRTAGLHLLEVEAIDSLGNQTTDVQAMLNGEWVVPNGTIANAVGLAVGPGALAALTPLVEQQVEAMNGDLPDQTVDLGAGIRMTIYGIAFCQPSGNPALPPYNCTPDVNVTLGLTSAGRLAVTIQIPTLYAGIRTSMSTWPCNFARDGYMVGRPVTVRFEANFVNTSTGVQLQAVQDSVQVVIGNLTLQTNHTCANLLVNLMSFIMGGLEGMVANQFKSQITSLLAGVNDMLSQPLATDPNTGRALWVARASNDASAVRLWMNARGNPCPSPRSHTNISDGQGGTKLCPNDSPRVAPGSYATPNVDPATLPTLDLVAPNGTAVSAEAGANDDFVNYVLHEQWAMGALDLTIDQQSLGQNAPLTLDTDALSLFVPDLKRPDVTAIVPLGSRVAIQTSMAMPPVIAGRQTTAPFYDLSIGEMTWRFVADADGNSANGYETPLFTAAVAMKAPAKLSVVPAATDNVDDALVVELGTPTAFTDVTGNPLVLNEGAVRSAIGSLINVALPSLTGSLSRVALPGNTARFSSLRIEAPAQDFLVLSGALVQTITLTSPAADQVVTSDPVVFVGTVDGLTNSGGARVALWLPGDTSGRAVTITGRPDVNSLAFRASIPLSALPLGATDARVVATDANGKKASLTVTLNRASGGVTRAASSGCGGCDGAGSNEAPLTMLLTVAFMLALLRTRRARAHAPLATMAIAAVLSGCGGCGETSSKVHFTGPAVAADPVFLVSKLEIGGADDGFNVDEKSPGGDPDPDNALQVLGPLANSALADAVTGGKLLLLVQFPGLTNLPASGETGKVEAIAYLGVDTDHDPKDNFSGSETFAKDPASFGEDGKPLIVFKDVELTGTPDGKVTMKGGPTTFRLSVPLQGSVLSLQISPTYIEATLGVSPVRADGIEAQVGLLGGVIPAAPLATPLEGLPFAPIVLLASEVDVDLNGDGVLDKTTTAENKDGLSAGILFAAVPAYLSNEVMNTPPVVTLAPLPERVTTARVQVTGTVRDRDGDCAQNTVSVTVNGKRPVAAAVQKAEANCTFSAEVRLDVGRNAIRATATDPAKGTAYAEVVTRLDDGTAPVLVLYGPSGNQTKAEQIVRGKATDNIGILAVQLDVDGTPVVVEGEKLAEDGTFEVPVTLPALGRNVITALAKDLGDNLSEPATLEITLLDVDAPAVVFTAAASERERLTSAGPWELTRRDITIEGTIDDNAGRDTLSISWGIDGGQLSPLQIDSETGAFQLTASLDRGTYQVRVVAEDASGNKTDAKATLTIADRQGPAIVVEAPDTLTRVANQELVLALTDDWEAADGLSATAAIGSEPPVALQLDAATGTFRRPIALVLGSNPIVIEAKDATGNVSRLEGAIELIDEEPPQLAVETPDDGSWTITEKITVTGRATDNIGQPQVVVTNEDVTASAVAAADGSFAIELPLRMGSNLLTISATDGAGLVAQQVRTITRRDPNAVATVDLVATPDVVAIGNDTEVTFTATLTKLAGGPVPDGTTVQFQATPANLGVLQSGWAQTTGGRAQVTYVAGRTAGLVTLTAEAQGESDTASVTLAVPSSVAVDVCLAQNATAAGLSFELGAAANAAFELGTPTTDATVGLGPAQDFRSYNRAAVPTMVLLAGTKELTGATGGTKVARVKWPLRSGLVTAADVRMSKAKRSDESGTTSDAQSALSVCAVEHHLGALPPRVVLAPLPTPTQRPSQVVTGTVEAADLAGCTAVLSVNAQSIPIDVTSGRFSQNVTLTPGLNRIRVIVTDADGRQGSNEIQVRYDAPNQAPQLAITAPGSAVSTTSVTAEGTVSDADDGLNGLAVTVRVGTGTPANAVIDANAGTWRAPVTLQAGNNTITVTATDARGATTVVTQATQVVAPVPPPRITLTSPTDGQTVTTQTITLAGRIDDGGNAATIRVTLTVNGTTQTITFSPFSRELAATVALQAGTNVLVVTATDLTGQSAVASRRVDYQSPDSPPRVTITSPVAGAKLATRQVTVRGTVRDDRSLQLLQSMKVNGVQATVDTQSGNWSATVTLTPGSRTITAEAIDERGQSGTASVTIQVFDPVVVVNYLQIGGPADGFNVDSTPPHALSDANPDNALSGLGAVANGPLQQAIDGSNGDPLILIFEIVGLTQLPAPGQSVTVDLVGYVGVDTDGDPSDNFSGTETFEIAPSSFDVQTGLPLIRFSQVVISNTFGSLRFDTFPAHPARFQLSVSSTTPPLQLRTDPAYLRSTLALGSDGLRFNPGLLGGVVPASTLTVPVSAGDLSIVPLQLLLSSDPTNPVPDVDLNGDGTVNTSDATSSNPDGVSVGIVFTAVPAALHR